MNPSAKSAGGPYTVAVRDPVWGHIWLTDDLAEITRSDPFLRLSRIKQLGPAEFAYPGATHTRAAHSLGVYHVARRMLDALIARGADEWVTPVGCRSFLAAALLHDIGHFPFTHSLKELPLANHESLTARAILAEPLKTMIGRCGADPHLCAAIIDEDQPGVVDGERAFFSKILSGVLDPDKLDYLNRDAYFCGVPYGIQDADYIISQILPDRERGIALPARAIMALESVLFSKYLMYRAVYWHRPVRVATAMMKKSLHAALSRGLISPEELYDQDDVGIYDVIARRDYPEREVALAVRKRELFRVIAEYALDEIPRYDRAVETLEGRFVAETRAAGYLTAAIGEAVDVSAVLIDIPENISFESSACVIGDTGATPEGSTVFTRDVIARFVSSIRVARVAVLPAVAARLAEKGQLKRQLAECFALR